MSAASVTSENVPSQENLPSQARSSEADGPAQASSSSPLASPPSSPPVTLQDDHKAEVPAASKKRSHEDMQAEQERTKSSSEAATQSDVDQLVTETQPSEPQIDLSISAIQNVISSGVEPSPNMASSMAPPNAPRSGQGTPGASTPQSAQQQKAGVQVEPQQKPGQSDSDDTLPDDALSDGSAVGEPQDPIDDFDWVDLESRYHAKMSELNANEQEIYEEFNRLCDFFGMWANTSQTHEIDRSFKRLRTQTTYVRHEEEELEQKRLHYIKVVEAFRSALQLLGN